MRSLIATFFLFFLINHTYAQYIKFQLLEKKTGIPVPNANVSYSFQKKDSIIPLGKSNLNGNIIMNGLPTSRKINIMIRHPMYMDLNYSMIFYDKSDTTELDLVLSPIRYKNLNVVHLKAPPKVDTVYGSDKSSILDFEVLGSDSILLLLYDKSPKKANKLKLIVNSLEIAQCDIYEPVEEIIKDYRGNIHAISMNKSHCIGFRNDSLIRTEISKTYFLNYLAPIVDTTSTKSILSNFNEVYPAFEYYALDKKDSTYKKITNIKDEWMMELYRSEYKWVDVRTKLWAREKEQDSGIDKEIWIGANYFTQSIYWKEVYAPMFERNDSIFVFNYPKDLLEIFDKNGDSLKSVSIYHHYHAQKSGFQKNLIQDGKTGIIYATFLKEGFVYVSPINMESGEIGKMYQLNYRYAENVKIFGNEVFYIYRPFESAQKKFLYTEKLPYKFRNGKVNNNYLISTDTGR